ncbi:GNAT family N-acetyltransferase [Kribbella sp. NPDC026596]|uniref:GNAT family N-acetyltransferase n=1 Tax=Kribbella sp. NPDC026596 TaxID=3155122 RepID=UPI0033D8E024
MKFDVRREELEFPVGLGLEEARVLFTGDHSDQRADGLGLVDGDTWAGIAWLDWWLLDNTDTVDVELAVVPSYRRQGVATRLLEAVIELARADGRRVLSGFNAAGDPVTGDSPGTRRSPPRAGSSESMPNCTRCSSCRWPWTRSQRWIDRCPATRSCSGVSAPPTSGSRSSPICRPG